MSTPPCRPEWQSSYEDHVSRLVHSRLRIGAVLVAVIFVGDGLFQCALEPHAYAETEWVRIVVDAVALCLAVGLRWSRSHRSTVAMGLGLVVAVAIDVEKAALATGALGSPYYAGLLLLLLGACLLVPLRLSEALAVALVVWAAFLTPIVFPGHHVDPATAALPAFFLTAGTGLGLVATRQTDALRRREFASKSALAIERDRADRLLLNVLPAPIAERLKAGEAPIADSFAEVSVMFADLVGRTQLATSLPPEQLLDVLSRFFTKLDQLADRLGVEKIKTIGDAYMAACGLPTPVARPTHAVARLALGVLDVVNRLVAETGLPLQVRVGVHTGPVCAGVIGRRRFRYDLWGDTVNMASRMESQGVPGRIQVSHAAMRALKDSFILEARGPVHIKGKGTMETFFLRGEGPASIGPAPERDTRPLPSSPRPSPE